MNGVAFRNAALKIFFNFQHFEINKDKITLYEKELKDFQGLKTDYEKELKKNKVLNEKNYIKI